MNQTGFYECRDWIYGSSSWKEWSVKPFFSMSRKRAVLTVSALADMRCYPDKSYLINKRSDDWRFYLITYGSGYFQRDQEIYSFSSGDLVIVAPQDTSWSFHILSSCLQMRKLGFVNAPGIQNLCTSEVSGAARYRPADFNSLLRLHDQMLNELGGLNGSSDSNWLISQWGFQFLYAVEEQCFNTYCSDPVAAIYNAVNAFPDKPYSISELAKSCGMSVRNLQRTFKKQTGSSILSLVTTCRIGLAQSLLKNTYHSVSEIAVQCCYKSDSLFCRTFKQKTGMSPKEFRKKYAASCPFTNTSNLASGLKMSDKGGMKKISQRKKELLWQINEKRNITIKELAARLKINPSAVQKHIASLKKQHLLHRIGSRRNGVWKISQPESLLSEENSSDKIPEKSQLRR